MLEIYNADKESEKLIKKVYKAALKYFSQKDIFEVEIEIVDKDEIQSINKEARGVDAVTDVLSFPNLEIRKNLPVKKNDFPLDVDPDSGKLLLGETVMCMDKILEQSDELRHDARKGSGIFVFAQPIAPFRIRPHERRRKGGNAGKEEEILKTIGLSR